ncbi:hypothetical protein EJP69_15000 [Variovorax gossypii]|uniref:Uncharacterized protein n=1 Tax=Variovorax gossypii TaxID=1679495 RepID=A0A3S0J7N1_9BURK|nr:hypothetical protein [Variovorax gossypii]RTQ33680.1 hypothetical protein EJP69_15000 [Variovorax gossypii]
MREDFSPEVIRSLKTRAGNVCSFPNCHAPTSGPSQESGTQTANTGVAAHICAASQGKGARRRLDLSKFDKSLLSDYSNGIWMCETHAKLIDTDEVRFTTEMLGRWRELAELRASLSQETGRSVQVHLRQGHEVPLAVVKRSITQIGLDVMNDMCDAVLDSCIVDVWGKDIGYAVRDVVAELMDNAFKHGGARQFNLDIDLNRILIRSDDGPYSFGQLLADVQHHGGQQAAASLMKLNDRLITSYRREDNRNVLEIAFITSSEQVLRTTVCSVDYGDFMRTLEVEDQLPAMYSNCETIYVVMGPRQHLVPSFARKLSDHLRTLAAAQKRIVLIGSAISEGVVLTLKGAFPDLQVVQV